ncbi:MAG: hypothetical protein ACR2JC_01470 [Chloroflexota bacterium]
MKKTLAAPRTRLLPPLTRPWHVPSQRLYLRFGPWRTSAPRLLVTLCVVVITLVPVLNIVSIVSSTGANNPSNDYLAELPYFDQMLSGTYQWQNFFHDSFIRSHSLAIPFLLRLAVMLTTHWNMYVELDVGLAAAFLKLLLLGDAFTAAIGRRLSWALWPALAALVFATSQINVFTYGDASLQIEMNQLGLAVGIWGLSRLRNRSVSLAVMAVGGLVACYSGAGGIPAWPAFLLGMVLLGYRSLWSYAVWLVAALLSSPVYVYFEVLHGAGQGNPAGPLLDLNFIFSVIGLPFSQGLLPATALSVGKVGVAMSAMGVALLVAKRRPRVLVQGAPALMCLAYGLINASIISVFRGGAGGSLAPWYSAHAIPVWIGLVGLAAVLWTTSPLPAISLPPPPKHVRRRPPSPAWRRNLRHLRGVLKSCVPDLPVWAWCLATSVILVSLYRGADLTYADKVFYLNSRSPASASCLRNYRVAPTYCEGYVFQWGVGHSSYLSRLAAPLERHHLSVFAPDETWTLQGDFVLDSVRVNDASRTAGAYWSTDRGLTHVLFSDYHHLNLIVPLHDFVTWSVALPSKLTAASFQSAVASIDPTGTPTRRQAAEIDIRVKGGRAAWMPLFRHVMSSGDSAWRNVSVPLTAYAGKTITLRLASKGGSEADVTAYRYPDINVSLDPSDHVAPEAATQPVLTTSRDLHFSTSEAESPTRGINVCLDDYSHLSLRATISPLVQEPVMTLQLAVQHRDGTGQSLTELIPFVNDGLRRTYTYDFKLLEQPVDSRLGSLALQEPYQYGVKRGAIIGAVRLVRRPGPSRCAQ